MLRGQRFNEELSMYSNIGLSFRETLPLSGLYRPEVHKKGTSMRFFLTRPGFGDFHDSICVTQSIYRESLQRVRYSSFLLYCKNMFKQHIYI